MKRKLVIAVGSKNPVKIEATQLAFKKVFPNFRIQIIGLGVSSGVAPQPMNDEETMLGAMNRAMRAAQQNPQADYAVGMEGGLGASGSLWFVRAWIAILGKDGVFNYASTQSFALPEAMVIQIQNGKKLEDIVDALFNRTRSGEDEGYFGIMTDGLITRTNAYRDACIVALVRTLHPNLFVVRNLEEHYPQGCLCQDHDHGLVANDCHMHNENPMHFDANGNSAECDCTSWQSENVVTNKPGCTLCVMSATWVRRTQFSGDHYFCEACAKQEKDFQKSDPSYFVWEKI